MKKSGTAKQIGADNMTRRVRFACRTNKALIQTHKQIAEHLSLFHGYNLLRERASSLRYTYSLCLVVSSLLSVHFRNKFHRL